MTTVRLAELAAEILPAGVLNVVTGHGQPTGQALIAHPEVDMVSLTGSVETGKHIARTAADTLKRVHLELGGKAPVVVFDDVGAGERAGDDRRHRLLQRRPGLHRGHARAGRREGLRRRRRGPRRAGAGPRDRRHARARDDARPGQLRPPARARRGLSAAPPRARGDRHGRQRSPSGRGSTWSRRSSRGSSRTTR